jgi:hypothetical protein
MMNDGILKGMEFWLAVFCLESNLGTFKVVLTVLDVGDRSKSTILLLIYFEVNPNDMKIWGPLPFPPNTEVRLC